METTEHKQHLNDYAQDILMLVPHLTTEQLKAERDQFIELRLRLSVTPNQNLLEDIERAKYSLIDRFTVKLTSENSYFIYGEIDRFKKDYPDQFSWLKKMNIDFIGYDLHSVVTVMDGDYKTATVDLNTESIESLRD